MSTLDRQADEKQFDPELKKELQQHGIRGGKKTEVAGMEGFRFSTPENDTDLLICPVPGEAGVTYKVFKVEVGSDTLEPYNDDPEWNPSGEELESELRQRTEPIDTDTGRAAVNDLGLVARPEDSE